MQIYQSHEVFTLMSIVDDMHIGSTCTKKDVEQFSLIHNFFIFFFGSGWKSVYTIPQFTACVCAWWRLWNSERKIRQAKLSTDWEINKQTNKQTKEKVQSGTGKQIDRQIPILCLRPKTNEISLRDILCARIIYLKFQIPNELYPKT